MQKSEPAGRQADPAATPGAILRDVVCAAMPQLEAMTDADAAQPRAANAWSAKQIIGHLIDSASNNHQRFVRAQFSEDMLFLGYDQDAWSAVQDHAHADWHDVIVLWRSFNLHLARVVDLIPGEQLRRERVRHNLDTIAWRVVPSDQHVTLEYFIRDYIGHCVHHLNQIPGVRVQDPGMR